jgi:hypothetical protein
MGVRGSRMCPSDASAKARCTCYIDDAPSEAHDYLFSFDEQPSEASAGATTVWSDDVTVDEERSPLVAAVVCAAHLAGMTPMLVHGADDSSDDEDDRERELDSSCSLAQCAGLLGVALARVYPPTAESIARAIARGTPVLVVHAGVPCVLHTVDSEGTIRAASFDTCVATAKSFKPKDVRYMFGFWSPVCEPDSEPEIAAETE